MQNKGGITTLAYQQLLRSNLKDFGIGDETIRKVFEILEDGRYGELPDHTEYKIAVDVTAIVLMSLQQQGK